jgi:hypothetical protein
VGRHRGPRAPSVGTLAGPGKGMGAALTHGSVVWLKVVAVVEVQGRRPCSGAAGHHHDHGGGDVDR